MAAIQFCNSADLPLLVFPANGQHIPFDFHSSGIVVHNQKLTGAETQLPPSQLEISADFIQLVSHPAGDLHHRKGSN